jgi:tetratricopeptide (TPR) repeat protein
MPGLRMLRFVVLMLLAVSTVTDATEGLVGLYNQGNVHYRNGDYEQAISAYEQVIGQGLQNGEVYYNLGNAYYKNEQLGHAILAYERALRLMPNDEDVLANLRFANARRVDKETSEDPNFLTRILLWIYHLWSINTLSVFLCFFVFGIAGGLVGWLFFPFRRVIWMVLLVVLGLGLVGSGGLLVLKVQQRGEEKAIVLNDEAFGRSGPGDDFLQVFVLHEGTKVFVERTEGNWFLVRLSNGVGGWVKRDALGII